MPALINKAKAALASWRIKQADPAVKAVPPELLETVFVAGYQAGYERAVQQFGKNIGRGK